MVFESNQTWECKKCDKDGNSPRRCSIKAVIDLHWSEGETPTCCPYERKSEWRLKKI